MQCALFLFIFGNALHQQKHVQCFSKRVSIMHTRNQRSQEDVGRRSNICGLRVMMHVIILCLTFSFSVNMIILL